MKYSRRAGLKFALATLGACQLSSSKAHNQTSDSISTVTFQRAAEQHDWLRVFATVDPAALAVQHATIEGDWPAQLRGAIYRTGPGHFDRAGHRYQHWFDGDGLLQKWDFEGSDVFHRAQFVATQKYLAEERLGEHRYDGFGTHLGIETLTQPNDLNTSNTSVVLHANELWSLWEGGSPFAFDPGSLQTVGPKSFSPTTDGVPFSAHPRVDQQGSLWNFGVVAHLGKLAVWEIAKSGELKNFRLLDADPASMPHDFLVTENYLILFLPPLHFNRERMYANSFLHAYEWFPDRATKVMVIDKNSLHTSFITELPAQWTFHFTNAWEAGESIHFEGCTYADPSIMFKQFSEVMSGEPSDSQTYPSPLTAYRLNMRIRNISQTRLHDDIAYTEFPTFDRRLSSTQHQAANFLCRTTFDEHADHGLLDTLLRVDLTNESEQRYTYPAAEIPEEHLFVPKPSRRGKTEGWLIGSSIDYKNRLTHLNVFNVNNIAQGPIARATVQKLMPLGLHGCYV